MTQTGDVAQLVASLQETLGLIPPITETKYGGVHL